MIVGEVYVATTLDRYPHIYSGSKDPVYGNVVLEFQPLRNKGGQPMEELFGPLRVEIIVEGELQTEVDESNTSLSTSTWRAQFCDRRTLFKESHIIHNGPFQTSAREKKYLPFTIFFPERAQLATMPKKEGLSDQNGFGMLHDQRQEKLGEVLPPTFKTRFDDGYRSGEAFFNYRVRAEVQMTGIDVDIILTQANPVLTYRPALAESETPREGNTFEQSLTVCHKDLLREEDRPHGFRETFHHLVHHDERPRYAFDVLCSSIPKDICAGQSFTFEVAVHTNHDRTTAHVEPEIMIDRCEITILGHTRFYAFDHDQQSIELKDTSDVAAVVGTASIEGAFSRFNDYTHTISTRPLPYLPNSFAVEKLSRDYRVRIDLKFLAGKHRVGTTKEFPIKVHPPLPSGFTEYSAGVGPSQDSERDEEQLPAYEEACRSSSDGNDMAT